VLDREANPSVYKTTIEEDKERMLLKERIGVIKKAQIDDVLIHPEEKKKIEALFYDFNPIKKPRDMRDIGTFTSLVKGFALLNFMHRESEGRNIFVNQKDVESGYSLWQEIAFFQEMGMPPYIFSIYKDVILPAFREKNNIPEGFTDFESKNGLKIQEILNAHYQHFHTYLTERKLRREILPMLVTARLITEGTDNDDKRAKVVFPVAIDRKQYIPSGARGSKKTDEISEKYYVNVPDVPSPQEADEGLLIIEDK